MTQKALADRLHVDCSVISKYEPGKISPSYDRLLEIADILGIEVDALLGDGTPQLPISERSRTKSVSLDNDRYYLRSSILTKVIIAKAGGVCELCGVKMPIIRGDVSRMLEAHYIEWLSKGGRNTESNIIVLCPTCHKYVHLIDYEQSVEELMRAKARR